MKPRDRVRVIRLDPSQGAAYDPATRIGLRVGEIVTLVGTDDDQGLVLEDDATTDCPWSVPLCDLELA